MQLLEDVSFIETLTNNQLEFYPVGSSVQADVDSEKWLDQLSQTALFTNAYIGIIGTGYRKYRFSVMNKNGVKQIEVVLGSDKIVCDYVGTCIIHKGEVVTVR